MMFYEPKITPYFFAKKMSQVHNKFKAKIESIFHDMNIILQLFVTAQLREIKNYVLSCFIPLLKRM